MTEITARYATCPCPEIKKANPRRGVLDGGQIRSVVDRYTQRLLDKIGAASVATSWPPMWKITPEHCASIPHIKAEACRLYFDRVSL